MGILVNDREIQYAEVHHIGMESLINEWDKMGNHRLRITDRKYRVGSVNRHVVGDWVPCERIASLIDGGSHGRHFGASCCHSYNHLPPVWIFYELPEGEPL